MKIEWEARWSGGMRQAAVLITATGEVRSQSQFARHVRHIPGGTELYRTMTMEGERVLFLYRSGSGRTETVDELPTGSHWDSFDEAEQALNLPEGSLGSAFGR